MTGPFGGFAPARLTPQLHPPARGYRIFSGAVWWQHIFWQWRLYLASLTAPPHGSPPLLGPRRPAGREGVWFTDRESLQGLQDPASFARRVALYAESQHECQHFGCAIVEFDVPPTAVVRVPVPAHPGLQQGLTPQGGREWFIEGNISLTSSMVVIYVEPTPGNPWYQVRL
jgi:hypothetical protein